MEGYNDFSFETMFNYTISSGKRRPEVNLPRRPAKHPWGWWGSRTGSRRRRARHGSDLLGQETTSHYCVGRCALWHIYSALSVLKAYICGYWKSIIQVRWIELFHRFQDVCFWGLFVNIQLTKNVHRGICYPKQNNSSPIWSFILVSNISIETFTESPNIM